MPLRCADISSLPGLEAIEVRGGEAALNNPIRWPYVAENRAFTQWVSGGELVFVTGISRHRTPFGLAESLNEGGRCGIAGLVILTGEAYIGQLPPMLGQMADYIGLPLFEQPYSLPMVYVTETISRAIIRAERQSDVHEAADLASAISATLGPDLLDALLERHAPSAVMSALSTNRDLIDAWLRQRGKQSAMADALGCHRNTVRDRLRRLEYALAESQGDSDAFATLVLAHLLQTLESRDLTDQINHQETSWTGT